MSNPLDQFISKGKAKFVVKLPVVPRLADSVRRGGLGKGAESYDDQIEKWRQGVEKALERLSSSVQPAEATQAVTNVTNIINSVGGAVGGVTLADINTAIAIERAARIAADATLQAQIDAITSTPIPVTPMNIEVDCASVAIGNGVDSGTVTGLGLSAVPSRVLLTLQKPVGGLNLWPEIVGDPTTDGFAWSLSGVTDAADYVLFYALIPEIPNTEQPVVFTVGGVPMPHGSLSISNGAEAGSVIGLGLGSVPTQAFVTVRRPSGGLNISALVSGALTADGFDVELSGMTDSASYLLDYLVAPAPVQTISLASGVDGGSVTGLGLSYTPGQVILTMRIPVGGLNLFANVVGNPTADGFSFALSGITDSADYKLEYVILA